MRKVYEIAAGSRRATVYRNSNYDCFTVKFYISFGAKWLQDAMEYESPFIKGDSNSVQAALNDAMGTAALWVKA